MQVIPYHSITLYVYVCSNFPFEEINTNFRLRESIVFPSINLLSHINFSQSSIDSPNIFERFVLTLTVILSVLSQKHLLFSHLSITQTTKYHLSLVDQFERGRDRDHSIFVENISILQRFLEWRVTKASCDS